MFWNVVLMILLIIAQTYLMWVLIVGSFAYERHMSIPDYRASKKAFKKMLKELDMQKRMKAQDAAADYLETKIRDKGGS